MTEIKKRLDSILNAIKEAATEAARQADDVQLLAVSKTWPADKVREMAAYGQRRFGENYLQEALSKIQELQGLNLEWHFIGPIQSNKTRDIAAYFDWAQSIDRLKVATRLNQQRPDNLLPLNVCIQVNIDNEDTKSGVSESGVMSLAKDIAQLPNLKLRGLMVIPSREEDEQKQRNAFQRARKLFEEMRETYPTVDTLSMGMTGDMQAAIKEGSTMVRIGTALFGKRHSSMSQ